ncbi:hypothetical protein N7539_009515 [Penicillium diatomitis]|uniref:SANT domain-containing protein n=1 Tax=Penicillium diatomitis TaxID=2819901 RepID=A0A9W9WK67_9EURO|nr:uncharacterized protein N7539_009515 [Penicillium diatomitis]KAJ5466559.1 hypothetical protein N7539_009515 [Penicillium diatomitis]
MSSRFPPSSGFNSRDRSPQRFGDRRQHGGPRGFDDGSPPFGREPPRGPRALVDSPGRGGSIVGSDRDTRDGPPPFRRDADREYGVRRDRDFDTRPDRIGFGRGRSRSPTRDFRDTRDVPSRDFDIMDLPPVEATLTDQVPCVDAAGVTGKEAAGEDASFSVGAADLGTRARFDRRDEWETRRPDREDRDRPLEPWKRDLPPNRADHRGSTASITASSANAIPLPVPTAPERLTEPELPDLLSRKSSVISGPPATEIRRESVRPDPAPVRLEPSKDGAASGQKSPPPSGPQVPAFGSVSTSTPPVGPAKAGSFEERASIDSKAQVDKDCLPFSPPTGPKAERSQSSHTGETRAHSFEVNSRHDDSVRVARLPVQLSDRSPPTAPAAMAKRESFPFGTDHSASGRPSLHTTSPTFTRLPPPAPRALSRDPSISPRMQTSNIPTGPRAYQKRPSLSPRGGGAKGIKGWGRSPFGRNQSVVGPQPKKEQDESDGKAPVSGFSQKDTLNHAQNHAQPTSQDLAPATDTTSEPLESTPPRTGSVDLPLRVSPQAVTKPEPMPQEEKQPGRSSVENEGQGPVDVPRKEPHEEHAEVTPQSEIMEKVTAMPVDEEEEEEEEKVVFTKEYLEERKQKFEKDMQSLRAEMPLSPLEDPAIINLLLKIQLLGKVAHDHEAQEAVKSLPSAEGKEASSTEIPEVEVPTTVPTSVGDGLDSAPITVAHQISSHEEDMIVDSLPFLHSGPPTPISDIDSSLASNMPQQHLNDFVRKALIRRQKEVAQKNAALREEYISHYKRWRLEVWEMDRLKEKKPMTPGPVSPPAPPVPTPPTAVSENREGRRYKGNSELDFLNALKASEISAQEELERRRTRMATAQPDLAREAIIPDMLEPRQAKAGIFKDVNNTVDSNDAMKVFGFLPPPNDFTPEEHQLFTDAFMAYPKKWGKIAESLPGRDFRQCIIHYYLTKEEIKYKAKLNKRWSRRGRGKARSTRPKSNALIADLGVVKPDFDGDEEQPPPVTDTGRPRRAAAPTFGDSNDSEGAIANSRRGQYVKDAESTEKPAARRGGRAAGARSQRRGAKVVPQEPKSQPSTPQGSSTPAPPVLPAHPAPPVPPAPKIESGMDVLVEAALPPEKELVEKEKEPPAPAPRPKASRGRAKDGIYVFESTETDPSVSTPKTSETGYGSLQPTSYWSVPEQRDFPRLLAHFGRDFEGISTFMKTKTTVMVSFHGQLLRRPLSIFTNFWVVKVKNYYQRRLDSGQKDFEDIVLIAEEKKARGEPTGPLPVPSVAPKRRYEATPSAIIPRPLAPHGESAQDTEDGRFPPKGKPAAISPQTVQVHNRPPTEGDRGSGHYAPLVQASAPGPNPSIVSSYGDDVARGARVQSQPSRTSGPRMGFFTEDRRDSQVLQPSSQRATDMPMPARHVVGGAVPQELVGMDPMAPQTYMPGQPPSSLMQPSHSRHSSTTQTPSSPTPHPRTELDHPAYHRDPFASRNYYSLPGQPTGLVHSPRPGLSPVKDGSRSGATPISEPPPRQVPAKRSNIMSILNDEPEEPQPRKRFASELPSGHGPGSVPASRPIYHASETARLDEAPLSTSGPKSSTYSQTGSYQTSSRGYPDYNMNNYGPPPKGSGNAVNSDWMARFDPRAPQGGR